MSVGKRVTFGTLLVQAAAAGLALSAMSCAPSHNPDYPGPPFVAKVVAFDPIDMTLWEPLYLSADQNCELDPEAGTGNLGVVVSQTTGFRIVLSELLDADKVEELDETGVGTELFTGLIEITNRRRLAARRAPRPSNHAHGGGRLHRRLPAGGRQRLLRHGQHHRHHVPAPRSRARRSSRTSRANLPGLPSGTELTLGINGTVPGHGIVDKGGAGRSRAAPSSSTSPPPR